MTGEDASSSSTGTRKRTLWEAVTLGYYTGASSVDDRGESGTADEESIREESIREESMRAENADHTLAVIRLAYYYKLYYLVLCVSLSATEGQVAALANMSDKLGSNINDCLKRALPQNKSTGRADLYMNAYNM